MRVVKNVLIHFRRTLKITFMLLIGIALICFLIFFIYKPIYSVSLNGEFVGYSEDKSRLQEKINDYISNGDNDTVAFVEISELPTYKICLLKKNNKTNDEEIFAKVVESGIKYYKYYAILDGGVEKYFVKTYDECEKILASLKEKDSNNIDKITYAVKYETESKEFADTDTVVANLYQKKVKRPAYTQYAASGQVNTKSSVSYAYADLGINFITPVSGMITSRFGQRSRGTHTGLDIATSLGTPVAATASGTVTFSGWKGSYGNMIVVSHGNGVETYYCHCSQLYVSTGMSVSQGQTICAVGSTGNSTGPHLHLEVRLNGVALNPQNYLYK